MSLNRLEFPDLNELSIRLEGCSLDKHVIDFVGSIGGEKVEIMLLYNVRIYKKDREKREK